MVVTIPPKLSISEFMGIIKGKVKCYVTKTKNRDFTRSFFMIGVTPFVKAKYDISPKMQWWYNSRLGMFIHFGSYSKLGNGEWAM
jgi:hypothetical protein